MNTEAITTAEIDTLTTVPAKSKAKRTAKPKAKAKTAKALPAKAPVTKPAAKAPKQRVGEWTTFKAGTKRAAAHAALIRKQGCTLTQAHEFLGWSNDVCGSEFREVSKLTGRKLVRDAAGAYRLA